MKSPVSLALICGLGLAFITTSCKHSKSSSSHMDALASHIDTTAKAGDDFFQYANGAWFRQNPIPASEQSNGIFQLVQDTVNAQIRQICESSAAVKSLKKGSNKQKIGDLFFSGMDSVALNKKGISDLKSDFDRIDQIRDLNGLISEVAYIHTVAASPLFNMYVSQDDKNSNKYMVFIGQGGLSLPERSFYFDTDSRAKTIRAKFVAHLGNMFEIMGYDKSKAKMAAAKLMEIQTSIAKTSRKREDTRDPLKNYTKMTFAKLSSLTPNINWTIFMKGVGLTKVDTVVVSQPEFLTALNDYLKKYTLNDWKNYLKYQMLDELSSNLDDKTYMEDFNFYGNTLKGIEEPKPRWKRVVEYTDNALGELIGQVYVKDYLPDGTKQKLVEIGDAVKAVYAERIKALDWMGASTKEKALKKLDGVIMKMGYPDKWKDMSALKIDRKSYVKNAMRANQWQFNYMINKYGKPVDRTEWDMQPQTYNAYYNPSNNEIVIPACNIIVPGYEGRMADDAILYAIIGGTIGHEITHGFDDQGCKYDASGNLSDWWTKEDQSRFNKKTKMIVNQYNQYVVVDDRHINGDMTQGENIADLGGLIMALEAFKKTGQYQSKELIAGLNPSQRFFLGFALGWMLNSRPEALASQVKSDVHSPAKWRVLGTLSNIPEFYEAFGVKKGDKMWRDEGEIVRIW